MNDAMKYDAAIQTLADVTWDWSERAFEPLVASLGLTREPDADAETPAYVTPWGKEWAQAIVDNGTVQRLELLVEETSPRWRPFTMKKLDALGRKYRDKLTAYVKRAMTVLGEPAFYAEYGKPGFPDDEDAQVLALWRRDTARLMVMVRNEGPDTPLWISIVVKPAAPQAPRAATARPSRPVMRPPTRQSATALDGQLAARFDSAIKTISSTRWDWSPAAQAAMVEQLAPASAAGNRIELTIEAKSPHSDDEGEDLDHEYCEKFERYVQRAERVLGKPKFNDGMARRGFPKDETAEFLALWPLRNAQLMILMRSGSADEHAPFSISVVVKPA